MEVKDVVTKRVIKVDGGEMVSSWCHVLQCEIEGLTLHPGDTTEDLRLLFAEELERSLRFCEAVQAGKTGDSQPMLDFLVGPKNFSCIAVFEEQVTKAKEDGLERELVIQFYYGEDAFELVFDENQVRLIETRFYVDDIT